MDAQEISKLEEARIRQAHQITQLNVWRKTNNRFDELYGQFCTKMGMKCTKIEFADIVVEHFDLLQEAQRKLDAASESGGGE